MAAHTHTYAPRIVSGAGVLDFTDGYIPLEQVSQHYTNRVRISEVPLRNGAVIFNVQRGPCTISFQGKISADTPEDMRTKMDNLRTFLVGGTGTPSKFTFYRHYNLTTGNFRWWRNCVCNDLDFDDGSRTVRHMPYNFSLTSADGVEYEQISTVSHNPDNPAISGTLLGPQVIKLNDDAGISCVVFLNSSNDPVVKIDSAGNFLYKGTFTQVSEIVV